MPDVCNQCVADAFSSLGILWFTSLGHINANGFSRTAVINGVVSFFVSLAQIAEITNTRPRQVDFLLGKRTFKLGYLEGKPCGRGLRISEYPGCSVGRFSQERFLVVLPQVGLVREGKGGSYLHARSSALLRLAKFLWRAVSPRQPKREPQFTYSFEINMVTLSVDGLTQSVKLEPPARRRVVPPGSGSLNNESIHPAIGLPLKGHR